MNTRPPLPARGGFMNRFFRSNLRPVISGISALTAVWSIASAIGFYRNVGPSKDNGAPSLATLFIIVGSLYMAVFLIGVFGLFASLTQKLLLIRMFAYLSALGVLIVAGVNLLRVITHFTMKNTILDACTNEATGAVFFYGGFWGPVYSDVLSPSDAKSFCQYHYDRDSWTLILAFIIITALGLFFSLLAFAYMRQSLDPSSPANIIRTAPYYQSGYGQGSSYNPPNDTYPPPQYPPPPGPPGGYASDANPFKDSGPPSYQAGNRDFDTGDRKD